VEERADLVRCTPLRGTPTEVGTAWGQINRKAIHRDLEEQFLAPARAAGVGEAQLAGQAEVFIRIAQGLAPHWLEECEAIAAAAGVDGGLYTGFVANVYRKLFLAPECTSYATRREHSVGVLFHKTRDNARRDQVAFLLESTCAGVNRFLAVSDASVLSTMMMVNDRGLAGSADTGGLPVKAPRFRGLMNTFILRHIAETAATCEEAQEIIRTIVGRGQYAGGATTGTHWLFADRTGVILEVSNNSTEVVARRHDEKVYFSARQDSAAARALGEAPEPIDFGLFHGVSRDPSMCFDTSISGMTVEIDCQHPDTLIRAWLALPARSATFPVHLGQSGVPRCLLDGGAYTLGEKAAPAARRWEALERGMHDSAVLLTEELSAGGKQGDATRRLDAWCAEQAGRILTALEMGTTGEPTPA